MQLRINHTTTFTYDGKATASYNQARLTPVTTSEQIVVHSRVEVSPKPWFYEYRDYFGAVVTAFEVVDPHEVLVVAATSTVQTHRQAPSEPTLTWADMGTREVADRWTEDLVLPDLVTPPHDFATRVKQLAADADLPGQAARAVCSLVHDQVEHLPRSRHVQSHAAEAWQQRAGVCQDLAHLVIGGLRTLGIPARYVAGYRHPDTDPAIGATVPSEAHAWVEWWDDGWTAYDPTCDAAPDDRYVSIGAGRDHDDVPPLRGIYSGASTADMGVEVDVTRLA